MKKCTHQKEKMANQETMENYDNHSKTLTECIKVFGGQGEGSGEDDSSDTKSHAHAQLPLDTLRDVS